MFYFFKSPNMANDKQDESCYCVLMSSCAVSCYRYFEDYSVPVRHLPLISSIRLFLTMLTANLKNQLMKLITCTNVLVAISACKFISYGLI